MEATSIPAPAAEGQKAPRQELKKGAISYISNVVIGVASTAPGYSLAATSGSWSPSPESGSTTPRS